MRWTIGKRIFAAVTVMAVIIVGLSTLATRWSFDRSFAGYLENQEGQRLEELSSRLGTLYGQTDSWQSLIDRPRRWDEILRPERRGPSGPPPGGPPPGGPPPRGKDAPPPPGDPLEFMDRVTLTDVSGNRVAGRGQASTDARVIPIEWNGETVGFLNVARQTRLTNAIDIRFAAEQGRSNLIIAITAVLIAALIAGLLARQLMRPISDLAKGTQALTGGDYEQVITVARDDELGDLAADFNALAKTLQQNRTSRQQWVSDIAHELRTPLSILNGELQAVEDGVRPFDEATLRSLLAEVDRLSHLVNDLHDLTRSDEGGLVTRRHRVDIAEIVRDTVANTRQRVASQGLQLQTDIPEQPVTMLGDTVRLEQLITNLIENSLRYTDTPGALSVSLEHHEQSIRLTVEDSAPGVPVDDLPRLFDRLFRVDGSRNRASGGSGLGLSICEAIVSAHEGRISAQASSLGGLKILVELEGVSP